ncbi:hypothetical protein CERSUDRAFT_99701 [Gelatoporia subvermispora B]|uniref:CxC1-like cysteine cluster associated with KDZ transposases domain-containing protein n=1 Tax=Ceriporiopsis subvermispora (strain B) TaxID=914234 RepID=M2R0C6_CERS8|nr:hypothetical protein CERSUDRAFT_99701 [Gelatoporia subvermispora B]
MPSYQIKSKLSRAVRVTTIKKRGGSGSSGMSNAASAPLVVGKVVKQADIIKDRVHSHALLETATRGLGNEALELLNELHGEALPQQAHDNTADPAPMDMGEDSGWVDNEQGSFAHTLRDVLASQWGKRWYEDSCTWHQRIERIQANWSPQMDDLVMAFLRWQDPDPESPTTNSPSPRDNLYDFEIDVIDLDTLGRTALIRRDDDSKSVIGALVLNGYLATFPVSPSLAISFKTLELFRRLRLRKPSFSTEAFARVVCDYYALPYRCTYRTALGETFDIYLSIHHALDRKVDAALG